MPQRRVWDAGRWCAASWRPSPNHGPRPTPVTLSLAIVHSISLPAGHYQGDAVQRLFQNRLDPQEHPGFESLRGLEVSAHFFVRRSGRVQQFVDCDRRAWHAGVSQWRGVPQCNDYSVGIELEGLEGDVFTPPQYRSLARLLRALRRRWPMAEVTGHEHVAPGRKRDPGPGFDWRRLQRLLQGSGMRCHPVADAPVAHQGTGRG